MKDSIDRLFENNPVSLDDINRLNDKINKMNTDMSSGLSQQLQIVSDIRASVDKIARQVTECASVTVKIHSMVDMLSRQFNSISAFENMVSSNINSMNAQQQQQNPQSMQVQGQPQRNNSGTLGFDPMEMSVPIPGNQHINMTQEQLAAYQAQQMALNRRRGNNG